MIGKFLSSGSAAKRCCIVMQSLALVSVIWMVGCFDDLPIDGGPDYKDSIGEITMRQSGGFAGVSRITSIGEEDGAPRLVSADQSSNQRKESLVSQEDLTELWQELEENEIFTLPTNQGLLGTVADGFFFEITAKRGGKYNQFSVYAPELLVESGETRYRSVVRTIQQFADSYLQSAEEFMVDDMPIDDVSLHVFKIYPLLIQVVVKGYLQDSCTVHDETTQRRDGNTIYVHITTKRPKDAMCLQVITEVTMRVPLEGGFLPGHYKLMVNDLEKDFVIQGDPVPEGNGILRGKVTIEPLCPVEPCDLPPERIAEIYEARRVIIYERLTKSKVTEVNLDRRGEYSLFMEPGFYIVDISDAEGNALPLDLNRKPLVGNVIPKEVEVRSGEIAIVNFHIDTGIR